MLLACSTHTNISNNTCLLIPYYLNLYLTMYNIDYINKMILLKVWPSPQRDDAALSQRWTPASTLDAFTNTNKLGVFIYPLKGKRSIPQGHKVPRTWLYLFVPHSEIRGTDMDLNWFVHTNAMHSMMEANNWILLKLCRADRAVSVIASLWHFANCSD